MRLRTNSASELFKTLDIFCQETKREKVRKIARDKKTKGKEEDERKNVNMVALTLESRERMGLRMYWRFVRGKQLRFK